MNIGATAFVLLFILGVAKAQPPPYSEYSRIFDDIPSHVNLRTAILTGAFPMSWYDNNITDSKGSGGGSSVEQQFPDYHGFFPDVMRAIQQIAKSMDNVTVEYEITNVPIRMNGATYVDMFGRMSKYCNHTAYQKEIPAEECHQWDLAVGDFYPTAERTLAGRYSPPLLTTGAATIQYVKRQRKRQIATLAQAQLLKEPVCLLHKSWFDVLTLNRYPDIVMERCDDHDECKNLLREEKCALLVEDELQLRYLVAQDADFELARDKFNGHFLVWILGQSLDPRIEQLINRWIYAMKPMDIIDSLYDKYFSISYCPLGKAGLDCTEPCSPSTGAADRYGNCVCTSTKWRGSDCSVEVIEDRNLIPTALKIVCYCMVAVNFASVLMCAMWLCWHRATPQVTISQPLFLFLVLLGCLISTSTIFALLAEDDDGSESLAAENERDEDGDLPPCMAIPWLYSVGFSITFGALFSKIRRSFKLFYAASRMERATMTIGEAITPMAAVLVVDAVILIFWTTADPLDWRREVVVADKFGNPLSSEGYCVSDHWKAFAAAIASLHFLLLSLACYMCYVSRHVPTAFSEGRYVALAMISNLQIYLVGIPVLVILGADSQTGVFVRSVIIWMNDFVVLALVFGNLMHSVHTTAKTDGGQGRKVTTSELIGSAMQEFRIKSKGRTEAPLSMSFSGKLTSGVSQMGGSEILPNCVQISSSDIMSDNEKGSAKSDGDPPPSEE